ncbi:hypothetical protein ABPG74_007801 [Tetrahymena malaccensis]
MQQIFESLKEQYKITLSDNQNFNLHEEVVESKIVFVEIEKQDYVLKIINLSEKESNLIDDQKLKQQLIYAEFLKKTLHPNIVKCYDYHIIGHYLCMILEKYQQSLMQPYDYRCMDQAQVNICRFYQFYDLLNGVSFIHQNGFLIRELSLSKIVYDHDYRLKMYDFQVQCQDLSNCEQNDKNQQIQFKGENQFQIQWQESFLYVENLHQDLNNILKYMIESKNQENIITEAMKILQGIKEFQERIAFLQSYQQAIEEEKIEEQYSLIKRGQFINYDNCKPFSVYIKLNKLLLEKYPKNIEYIIDKVKILFDHESQQNRNLEAIIELCQRVLKIDQNNEQAEQYICLSLAQKYEDKSNDYYLKFLERFPENVSVKSRLASNYYFQKQYQNALNLYKELNSIEQETQYFYYHQIGKTYKKLKMYEESIIFFNLSIEYWNYKCIPEFIFEELAKSYMKLKKYQVAIGYLQKPNICKNFRNYQMGKIQFKLQQYQESLQYLQVVRNYKTYKVQTMLSEVYFELKIYDKAVEIYLKSKYFSNYFYYNLAVCYFNMYKFQNSIYCCKKYLQIFYGENFYENEECSAELVNAYLIQQNYQKALKIFQQAIKQGIITDPYQIGIIKKLI